MNEEILGALLALCGEGGLTEVWRTQNIVFWTQREGTDLKRGKKWNQRLVMADVVETSSKDSERMYVPEYSQAQEREQE